MREMIRPNRSETIGKNHCGMQFRNPQRAALNSMTSTVYTPSIEDGIQQFCLQPTRENGKSHPRLFPDNREKHRNHSELPCAQPIHSS
jgi:hypothetical protein